MADFDATRSIMGETDIVYELRDLCNSNVLDTGKQREAANEIEWLRGELGQKIEALADARSALASVSRQWEKAEAERDALYRMLLDAKIPAAIIQAALDATRGGSKT